MPSEAGEDEAPWDWSWTQDDTPWMPPEIDTSRPSPARMYDYALDGKDNFEVDRAAVLQVGELVPGFRETAKANRSFLVEAVRVMAEHGVSQFIDIGSGLPTSPNVHEVAQQVHPAARVVYVDNDPIVMAHNRALSERRPGVVTVQADMRQPPSVLSNPTVRQHLDFDQPIGLLFIAVLHFVRRDIALGLVKQFLRALPDGSFVAISSLCANGMDAKVIDRLEQVYARSSVPLVIRTHAEIEQLFEGLDVIHPGLKDITHYTARGEPTPLRVLSGIGKVLL